MSLLKCKAILATLMCVAVILAVTGVGYCDQSDISVSVVLSRDTIGLDENAVLEVTVSGGAQDLPAPKLPTLPKFEVYSQGHSSNISIVNGAVEASVSYNYLMLPQEAGVYPIENVAIVYHNKRYTGNTVTLTVLNRGTATTQELEQKAQTDQGESRDYFLEAEVDNKHPYVNEQVTLTLKFYTAVQYLGSPTLVAEPTTTGFWTELIGNKAPYRQRISNRTYRVIERKYALFPTQTGELSIGRATISFTVATRRSSRSDPFDIFGLRGGRDVQISSRGITLHARPLPQKGRPDDFSGSIGQFSMHSSATKTNVEINQPVTVTININGTGNIKSVAEPEIPESEDFRVYRASSNERAATVDDKIGGTKTFEEVFIPKRAGELTIPSLSLSYFDPKQGKYRTARTRPIKLNVTRPEGYSATTELPYSGPDVTIGSDARDIRYIKTDLGKVQPRGRVMSSGALYVAVNALSVLFLVVTVVFRIRREKLSADVGLARSRAASKQAKKRLARARQLAEKGDASEFYAECARAVTAYVADKLNQSPHGMTSDSIADTLAERGARQEVIDDTVSFLNRCGFARYAPSSSGNEEMQQSLHQAQNLMVRIEGVKL